MKPSVEYFAFVVDRDCIHPSPRKVQAIQELPVQENPKELKSFLGLVNYYRRFVPDMATLVHPLNRLLVENIPWKWSKQCQEAFQKLKAFCNLHLCWHIRIQRGWCDWQLMCRLLD